MIGAIGSSISIKIGHINLGSEGEIYLGGFLTAIILNTISDFAQISQFYSIFSVLIAFFISFACSGLITFFCALLKERKNADFLFTTFIFSSAIIPIIDELISGIFRDKSGNLLSTKFIHQVFRIKSFSQDSPFNYSIIFGIFLCILFFLIFYRTSFGRKIQILGISPEFAKFSSYNTKKLLYISSFISGGFFGICGSLLIIGTYFTCHLGFYSGIGWNCLCVSLIASANPIFIIPCAILFSFLTTYADRFALFNNIGFDISSIIQSVILLLISFPIFSSRIKR